MQTLAIPDQLPVLKSLDMEPEMLSVARIPGTDEVFAGANNGVVYHVDLGAGTPTATPMPGAHLSYVSAIVQRGDIIVSAGSDHRLVWWNRATHERIRTIDEAHSKWIRDLSVHPQQPLLASVGDDMRCRLWHIETGACQAELCGHEPLTQHDFRNKLFACAFSRDGSYLATADQTGRIVIWDVAARTQAKVVDSSKFYEWDYTAEAGNGHSFGGVRALDFSPDGSRIAVGGILNTDAAITNGQALLHVYDWQQGSLVTEYAGGGNFFYENVRFHHAGAWIMAAPGAGGAVVHVNFFDPAESKLLKKSDGLRTYDLALSETSDTVYVVGPKKIAKLGIATPAA